MVAILSRTGEKIADYEYDAWGRLISQEPAANSIGNMNPLRYRGYIYDVETGFYYLQSRYYDPEIGRFINADAFASTGQGLLGNNMFAYCRNNPVIYDDSGGYVAKISFSENFDILDMPWHNSGGGGGIYIRHTGKSQFALVEEITQVSAGEKTAGFMNLEFDAFNFSSNSITVLSADFSVVSLDLNTPHVKYSLFDLGNASLAAGFNGPIPSAEAMVSIWSPSVTFAYKSVEITSAIHMGAIGFIIDIGPDGAKLGLAAAIGFTIDLSWTN